jgi:hypothetical protein
MKKSISQLGLFKIANTQVNRLEQFDKLKEIANRNNYPYKITELKKKVQEQYDFWNLKSSSQRLDDLTRDLIFIKSQTDSSLNKERIDELMSKYF